MLFRKRFDDNKIECKFCHQKVKPIIESNKFNMFKILWLGRRYSGLREAKYILTCPNCKAVIGTK